jgi:hypothetical protein
MARPSAGVRVHQPRIRPELSSKALLRQSERVRDIDLGQDLDRLRHAIREELAVQHGIAGIAVNDRWLDSLADMLLARIDLGSMSAGLRSG